jgi:hypothetical protein
MSDTRKAILLVEEKTLIALSEKINLDRGFFKSRMTFEKATLNLRTFRSASCGTHEARAKETSRFLGKETARGLSKLTEF